MLLRPARVSTLAALVAWAGSFLPVRAAEQADGHALLPAAVRRVLFLGDSITHGGGYVSAIETYFITRHPARASEFVNAGLSSETVSGLSEEGHAGGKFPRPDLHERLDRVLGQIKPDLVFACYGMNDGIYLPFAAVRFAKFRDGVHPDEAGHWVMARAILAGLGATDVANSPNVVAMAAAHPHGKEILQLVTERQNLLKLAWLTATGHKRPGVKPGLPLDEARAQAAEFDRRIALLK